MVPGAAANPTIDNPTRTSQVMVNGLLRALDGPIHRNALDFLRSCGLTGCKEGCAEGECGACAILLARPLLANPLPTDPQLTNDDGERTRWTAVNACLLPAAALDGQEVITVEGLGSVQHLHPVQWELAVRGGSQCGYCTPGFVCSMAAEYYRPDRHPNPPEQPDSPGDLDDAERGPNGFDLHALSGNLCRCTGYRPIRDAGYALGEPAADDPLAARRARPAPAPVGTDLTASDGRFRRPTELAEALDLLRHDPDSTVVAGSTDWGVDVNLKGVRTASMIAIDRLEELRRISWTADHVDLGAALTLTELEQLLAGRVPLLAQLLPQFASRLIRNAATLGGNLGTGSPIGDAAPALLALDASLLLASTDGGREVRLADYFTGYRTTVRRPDELITTVRIPLPSAGPTAFHKIAKRRFDDISSVAIGYAFMIDNGVISTARIGLGGVAATPLRATATEATLQGRPWSRATITEAAAVLAGEGSPLDDHRASARYRSAMLGMSLHRLWAEHSGGADPAVGR